MVVDFAEQQDIDSWMDLLHIVKDNFPGLDIKKYRISLLDCILKRQALIAKVEDVVVAALAFTQSIGELKFLAVHPLYRQRGIAKALITKFTSQFPKGMRLSVITYRQGDERGIAARKLYQSIGFQQGELLTV
ncbi:MAG: GNAT family N-acetyltransferase, partial [Christensenella sp.]